MVKKSLKRKANKLVQKNSVPVNSDTTFVTWEKVKEHLPASIRECSMTRCVKPISIPWVQSGINGLMGAIPALHTAMNSSRYLEIIGPPEALATEVIRQTDKQGRILGGILDKNGKLQAQTRFKDAAGSLNTAAAAAATFQILSVATSQYYLHQINHSLSEISIKVDTLIKKMEYKQLGEIQGAIEIIDEIYNANLSSIETTGRVAWQAPDKVEFWSRMGNAEKALRENVRALEGELAGRVKEISVEVRKDEDRVKESYKKHIDVLGKLKELHQSGIVHYYLLALRGMIRWYQLVLAFDCYSLEITEKGRYNAMTKYIDERYNFLMLLCKEYQFVLERPDGESLIDQCYSKGSAVLGSAAGWFIPGGIFTTVATAKGVHDVVSRKRQKNFKENRDQLVSNLGLEHSGLFITMEHLGTMAQSLKKQQKFYLGVDENTGQASLQIAY